jgi:hypothetical protein
MRALFAGLIAGLLLLQMNCVPPPPSPRSVVVPASPRPGAVWVTGHWQWRRWHHEYVWIPGHWKIRRGHVWVIVE